MDRLHPGEASFSMATIETDRIADEEVQEQVLHANILNAGTLSEVISPEQGMECPHPQDLVWSGAITLARRIESNPEFANRVDTAIEHISDYFVPADVRASTRCIDGRVIEKYDNSLVLQTRTLGAQVPGGTASIALVNRVVEGGKVAKDLSFYNDINKILQVFEENDLAFGGHVDDHAHEGNTGCGAIDKLPDILRKFSQFESQQQLRGLTEAMLGEDYNEDIVNIIIGRLLTLQSEKARYLLKDPTTGEYTYKIKSVEIIEAASPNTVNVEKLVGKHNEVALVINMINGTTFDRDRFSKDNNHEIQAFNYDMWRSKQIAKVLYPETDGMSDEKHHEAQLKQLEYITCRAMYSVATAMVLTDGSVKLLVRTPETTFEN